MASSTGFSALTGFSNAAENTVTIGGVAHYVVPNVFRTDQTDYFAIKRGLNRWRSKILPRPVLSIYFKS